MSSEVRNGVSILMYHQIAKACGGSAYDGFYCVSPRVFASHMWYLRMAGFQGISMSQLAACMRGDDSFPKKPVVITIDDGYASTYTHAFPILRMFGFRATVYLVAGLIGKTNRWDEPYGVKQVPLMNLNQIRDLASNGIELGAHTLRHPNLTEVPVDEAIHEIAGAKRSLEEMTGVQVNTFAYPYGEPAGCSEEVRRIVIGSGYLAACGTMPGNNYPDTDLYALKRLWPKAGTHVPQLAWKLRRPEI